MKKVFFYFGLLCFVVISIEAISYIILINTNQGSDIRRVMPATQAKCNRKLDYLSHPYLGFVNSPASKCVKVNSKGFVGERDFPINKNKDFFDILIIGGSVAESFATIKEGGEPFFEKYLNDHYKSPDGRPFRVFNGALAGYSQPQQYIVNLLFGEFADSIISIEGFNELYRLKKSELFKVDIIYAQLNGYFSLREIGLTTSKLLFIQLYTAIQSNRLLSNLPSWRLLKHKMGTSLKKSFSINHGEKLFQLQSGLSEDKAFEVNLSKYEELITNSALLSQRRQSSFVHFFQPVSSLFKTLTPYEKNRLKILGYKYDAKNYLKMSEELVSRFKNSDISVFSLLKAFDKKPGTYYRDEVHLNSNIPPVDKELQNGQKVIAESIMMELKLIWSLKTKQSNL
jgi:hypothetical protein